MWEAILDIVMTPPGIIAILILICCAIATIDEKWADRGDGEEEIEDDS